MEYGIYSKKTGFTDAYERAALAQTAIIDDVESSGLNTDHAKAWKDPTLSYRRRVAKNMAEFIQQQLLCSFDNEKVQYLDVGCATGGDMELLLTELDAVAVESPRPHKAVQLHGLDLLEAQLEKARTKISQAQFKQGSVMSLPYEDSQFDVVHASRLIIHLNEPEQAIQEMIRVLKPGGLGVFSEANMECSLHLLSTDERMRFIFAKKNDFISKMCANPRAASCAYAFLRTLQHVESVTMQSFSCILPNPAALSGDLIMDQQFLKKMAETKIIEQSDVDYYLEQAENAIAPIAMLGPFQITFYKK